MCPGDLLENNDGEIIADECRSHGNSRPQAERAGDIFSQMLRKHIPHSPGTGTAVTAVDEKNPSTARVKVEKRMFISCALVTVVRDAKVEGVQGCRLSLGTDDMGCVWDDATRAGRVEFAQKPPPIPFSTPIRPRADQKPWRSPGSATGTATQGLPRGQTYWEQIPQSQYADQDKPLKQTSCMNC